MGTHTRTVLGFGDSIAAGCGSPHKYGWMQRLRDRYYAHNTDYPAASKAWFHELAVPGMTAEHLVEGITQGEASRRYRADASTLSIVSLGGQQPSVDIREKSELDLPEFALQIGAVASHLYDIGDVLYVGVPAPNVQRLKAVRGAVLDRYTDAEIGGVLRTYEAVAIDALREAAPPDRNFRAVPLFDATHENPDYGIHPDAVHPDDRGHHFIYEHVRPYFDELVGISADQVAV
jgi:lysophospholipase L1-like esterase